MAGGMGAPCVAAGLPVVTVPLEMFPRSTGGDHPAPVAADEGESLFPESQLLCCIKKITAPEGGRCGEVAWFVVQKRHQTFPDHEGMGFRMETVQDCQNLIMKGRRLDAGASA